MCRPGRWSPSRRDQYVPARPMVTLGQSLYLGQDLGLVPVARAVGTRASLALEPCGSQSRLFFTSEISGDPEAHVSVEKKQGLLGAAGRA